MKNKFEIIEQKSNRNFFGDFKTFKKEMEQTIFNFFSEDGSFWINKTKNNYHIKYAVNNFNTLTSILTQNFDKFKSLPCLLEINYHQDINENFINIKKELKNLNFNIEEHHIAYVKNYFKNKENSSNKITLLNQNDLENIINLLKPLTETNNSLPYEILPELILSKNNYFLGYYDNNQLLGIILFSLTENIEKIGFIRELLVSKNTNMEKISNELLNFSLNHFSINGFSKAFYWGDAKNKKIIDQFLKYGFKFSDQQIVVFTKE